MEHEFTDRYEALGMPYPDPETWCKGECEGVGWYPVKVGLGDSPKGEIHYPHGTTDEEYALWREAHDAPGAHTEERPIINLPLLRRFKRPVQVPCDGYHFITCPDCGGTGLRRDV